jgi:antitoxin (DNA-binding transcriptional repressor) of toxin-antitoxin stability system
MTVTVEQAQSSLPHLIACSSQGEAVIIMQGDQPVAELHAVKAEMPRAAFGSCRGMLAILADDDEHLADFHEHMP